MKFYQLIYALILSVTFFAVGGTSFENYDETLSYDPKEVEVWNGKLRGVELKSANGIPFYGFYGINYAKSQRFKHSVPTGKWVGVFNATQNCNVCPQFQGLVGNVVVGQEDCLCINVFSPNTRPSKPLPVYVFIHGGAFTQGTINSYLAHRWMDYDVVVALMSYRLGMLGNLCTGDSASPGNYAIHDQITALRWFKQNIRAFGGDPDRITIGGQSSGAASVTHLLLSPPVAQENLVSGAISESGSAVGSWAYDSQPLVIAKKLAAHLNCPTEDTYLMVDCVKNRSVSDIVSAARLIRDGNNYLIPSVPCKDNFYVVDDPRSAYLKGNFHKVPLLIGSNSEDGSVNYQVFPQVFSLPRDEYFNVLPTIIGNLTKFRNHLKEMATITKQVYYSDINITDQKAFLNRSIQFFTDEFFLAPAHYTAFHTSKEVFTYVYNFAYRESFSTFNVTGQIGVQHGDELLLMFFFPTIVLSEADKIISKLLLDNFVSFITKQRPTDAWTNTKHDFNLDYFDIRNEGNQMKTGLRTAQALLWNTAFYVLDELPPISNNR